jgi:hypothetical protein
MTTVTDELLCICWPGGMPRRLDRLVHRPLAQQLLRDYKLEPIFSFDDPERPPRLTVSAQGERDRWQQVVAAEWPSTFLEQGPEPTRWMVDSDGSDRAVVYLDDLQNTQLDLAGPHGLPLMCLTLDLASAARGQLTRHAQPPLKWLSGTMETGIVQLLEAGAVGVWALRWEAEKVAGVAWISESRWRRNPASARRAVRVLGENPVYDAALRCLAEHGRVGYPDVVEIFCNGTVELTMGVL